MKNSLRLSEAPSLQSWLSCRQEAGLLGAASSFVLPVQGFPLPDGVSEVWGDGISSLAPSQIALHKMRGWLVSLVTHTWMRAIHPYMQPSCIYMPYMHPYMQPSEGCAVSARHRSLPHFCFLLAAGRAEGIAALAARLLFCSLQAAALGRNLCFTLFEPDIMV